MTRAALLVSIIALVTVALAACAQPPYRAGTATIEGTLAIGPLCPVEPCNVTPQLRAEAYALHPIVVYNADSAYSTVLGNTTADPATGRYSLVVPTQTVVVRIENLGPAQHTSPPYKVVELRDGGVFNASFSVDTGIR